MHRGEGKEKKRREEREQGKVEREGEGVTHTLCINRNSIVNMS